MKSGQHKSLSSSLAVAGLTQTNTQISLLLLSVFPDYHSYLHFFKRNSAFLKNKRKTKSYQKEKPQPRKNSQHFVQHKLTIFVFCNHGLQSALAAFISYGVASEDQLPLPSHVGQETDTSPTRLWLKGLVMLLSSPRRDSTDTQGPPQSSRADKFLKQGEMLGRRAQKSHQEGDASTQDLRAASLSSRPLPCSST